MLQNRVFHNATSIKRTLMSSNRFNLLMDRSLDRAFLLRRQISWLVVDCFPTEPFNLVANILIKMCEAFSVILFPLILPCLIIVCSPSIHQWISNNVSSSKLDIPSVLFLATGLSNLVALSDINTELTKEHKA